MQFELYRWLICFLWSNEWRDEYFLVALWKI